MQTKKIAYSINCLKINKENLKITDNGIWLNGTLFLHTDVDSYGSIGFITEKPAIGKQATIIGQLKPIVEKKIEDTDIPF